MTCKVGCGASGLCLACQDSNAIRQCYIKPLNLKPRVFVPMLCEASRMLPVQSPNITNACSVFPDFPSTWGSRTLSTRHSMTIHEFLAQLYAVKVHHHEYTRYCFLRRAFAN